MPVTCPVIAPRLVAQRDTVADEVEVGLHVLARDDGSGALPRVVTHQIGCCMHGGEREERAAIEVREARVVDLLVRCESRHLILCC